MRNDALHYDVDLVALRAEHFSHLHNLKAHREMTAKGEAYWQWRAPAPEIDNTDTKWATVPMITDRQVAIANGAAPKERKLK